MSPAVSHSIIHQKLQNVIDPELGINIVDLGLIYQIKIQDSRVYLQMTLTTVGCPLADMFDQMIRQELGTISGFDPHQNLDIEITFDPPWHQGLISEKAQAQLGF